MAKQAKKFSKVVRDLESIIGAPVLTGPRDGEPSALFVVLFGRLEGASRPSVLGRGELIKQELVLADPDAAAALRDGATPTAVLPGAMYQGSWSMPTGGYAARLIADAGGQYVYTQDTGNQSRPIDTEEAYRLAEMSDCWINVGSAASLKELAEIVPKFMDTRPVREGRVYNNNRRTNPSGGNDYWESGVIHPDLILQDLIRIFHPELTDAEPTYYRKLN